MRGITAYRLISAAHPHWTSLTYVYRAQAEQACAARLTRGESITVVPCEISRLSAQLVATDRYGGCTQRRAVTDLRYGQHHRQKVIYGRVQVRRRSMTVMLPGDWTGHEPLWRVVA